MAEEKKQWPNEFKTARDLASALNWVRWKSDGRALVLLAIGRNSVAIAKGPAVDAEDVIVALESEKDTIARLLREMGAQGLTHASTPRPDGRS